MTEKSRFAALKVNLNMKSQYFSFVISFLYFGYCFGQEPVLPEATEDWSSSPRVYAPIETKWTKPVDAITLLDVNVCQWVKKDGSPLDWTLNNGVMTVKPGSGDIISKMSFEDCHLHLEWMSPKEVKGSGQNRGNSGVFLQSRYEVQILDSYDNETYYNGQAASVYKQHAPLVNACAKPGEWNVYDIIFRAPKYDLMGKLLETASVTVIHNGYVVQNNAPVVGTTTYIGYPKPEIHHGAPLMLQDHGCLVSFRNIWIRRL
jgi:hypothetical protein